MRTRVCVCISLIISFFACDSNIYIYIGVAIETKHKSTNKTIDTNPIKMSKITLLLFVVALTLCIAVQFISAAPTLQENEEGQLAGCGHQAAPCHKNSDCCFYLKCDKFAKLCYP